MNNETTIQSGDWKARVRTWAKANGYYGRTIEDAIEEAIAYAEPDAEFTVASDFLVREREELIRDGQNDRGLGFDSHDGDY